MKTISFIDLSCKRYSAESSSVGLELTLAEDLHLKHDSGIPASLGTGIILHPDSYSDVGAMQLQLHPRLSCKGICAIGGSQVFDPKFVGSTAHKYDAGLYLHVKDLTRRPTIIVAGRPAATLVLYSAQGLLMLPGEHYECDFDSYAFSDTDMNGLRKWAKCYGGFVDDTYAN